MTTALMFRAGRLQLEDRRLVPRIEPGFLRILEEPDGKVKLQWLRRQGASIVGDAKMDVPIEVGTADIARVGPAVSRAFKIYGAKYGTEIAYFWMQEQKPEEDELLLRRLKHALTGGDTDAVSAAAAANPQQPDSTPAAVQAVPSDVGPLAASSQPMEVDAAAAASPGSQSDALPQTSTAALPAQKTMSYRQAAATGLPETGAVTAAQLAAVLSGIAGGGAGRADLAQREAAQALQDMRRRAARGPSLADILSPDVTIPLAMEAGMLDVLSEQMPQEHRSASELRALLESPQLRRQMCLLHQAIASGALDLRHFGLQSQGFSIIDFLRSVQEKYGKSSDKDAQ